MPLAETVHMHYEYLFWSMAAMVAAALAGGALCGRLQSVKQLVIGLLGWAAAIFAVVLLLARQGGFDELAAMMSIAAFMFSLVIGAAAALLTRRIRLHRQQQQKPQSLRQ